MTPARSHDAQSAGASNSDTGAVSSRLGRVRALPVGSSGRLAAGYWGVWTAIGTEGALFAYLLFSYFYLAAQSTSPWPPNGMPALGLTSINTLVLLASSGFVIVAERSIRTGRVRSTLICLMVALLLGCAFASIQAVEWSHQKFNLTSHAYGSLYFTITGFHMAHVLVGLVVLATLLAWTALGKFDKTRYAPLSIGGLYWHFVDVVWIAVFCTLYLSPYGG